MANENKNNKLSVEDREKIVMSAFDSLDVDKYSTEDALIRAVAKRSITLTSLLSENSIPMRALDSVRLYADVLKVEYEESSHRYILTFKVVNRDEETEEEDIRTPRMDARDGRILKPVIDDLIKKVKNGATRALIYKNNEPAKPGSKGAKVPSNGYRTLIWLRVY